MAADDLVLLRNNPPMSGRFIGEDGEVYNVLDLLRMLPENIARGFWPGATPFGSYGRRDAMLGRYLLQPDGDVAVPPTNGVRMSVASTSENDAAAGTHVQGVEIHYLDRSLTMQRETVYLNGTTPVQTAADDIRWIQDAHIGNAGDGASLVGSAATAHADGAISITHGGTTYGYIAAGRERSESSFKMVPAGYLCHVVGAIGSAASDTAVTTALMELVATELDAHQYLDPVVFIPHAATEVQDGTVVYSFPPIKPFRPGTLIGFRATTTKAARVTGTWIGRLEPDA